MFFQFFMRYEPNEKLVRFQTSLQEGVLERAVTEFKDRVDFLMVYQKEAHPSDGWAIGSHMSWASTHTDIQDRANTAKYKSYNTFPFYRH